MEQLCYKCGQTVEEGIPFCPHCSAPQIRVIVAEPPVEAVLPAQSGAAAMSHSQAPAVVLPTGWSAALRPCLLAAFSAVLLAVLGLYPFVAMLITGFLAVLFYRQRWSGTAIRPSTGVRLGVLSGLLWFAIFSIVGAIQVLFLHKGPELRDGLLKLIEKAASQTTDPQLVAAFDRFKTPAGLEFLMVFLLVCFFFMSIALSIVGGALAGTILSRRRQ